MTNVLPCRIRTSGSQYRWGSHVIEAILSLWVWHEHILARCHPSISAAQLYKSGDIKLMRKKQQGIKGKRTGNLNWFTSCLKLHLPRLAIKCVLYKWRKKEGTVAAGTSLISSWLSFCHPVKINLWLFQFNQFDYLTKYVNASVLHSNWVNIFIILVHCSRLEMGTNSKYLI